MQQVVGQRKQSRLKKVLTLAREKRIIANDDVQLALTVSDATATRYLAELVKFGSLRRISRDGGTRYEPSDGANSAV